MKFDEVALNDTPEEDEVAVGSLVIFPQGKYVGTAGNNEGGVRYHKGMSALLCQRCSGLFGTVTRQNHVCARGEWREAVRWSSH